jgi:hypothetical protein
MFTITGLIKNTTYSLTYDDGRLSGDDLAVTLAREESKKDHGPIGLHPEVIDSDYLSQEIPAYALITSFVFDEVEIEENDWEDVPDDAVF